MRAQFPAFQEPSLRDEAFFQNAGGSYACRYAIWRLHRFYRERRVDPGAPFAASELGAAEIADAYSRMALILGVGSQELCFGPSTSANIYVLAQAFRDLLVPGDAIVVTNQDHEANSGPWRRLEAAEIDIREWRVDAATGHLDPEALTPLLADGRVRLVCFPHCSNVIGEINDAAAIAAQAHRAGAWVCVDGVSYAPHGLPNVGRLGADAYLFSTDKTYGPRQGVMVVRRRLAEKLPNQGHWFHADDPRRRFTPAGPDPAQVAAIAGIADYVDALYHHHEKAGRDLTGRATVVKEAMRARERHLMEPLLDWADSRGDLRMLGPRRAQTRVPTFAFALDRPGAAVAGLLARHGIMAGGGDFCAPRPLAAMGVEPKLGVLRVSFLHYTSAGEVARLIAALDRVL